MVSNREVTRGLLRQTTSTASSTSSARSVTSFSYLWAWRLHIMSAFPDATFSCPAPRHLWSILLWVVALLYGGGSAHASEAPYTSGGQAATIRRRPAHRAVVATGSDASPTLLKRSARAFSKRPETSAHRRGAALLTTTDPKDIVKVFASDRSGRENNRRGPHRQTASPPWRRRSI